MIRRIKFTAEAFEKYLDGLNEKFDTTIIWNTLQNKSEYGIDRCEKGYQKVASVKATIMANKLGLNLERASFYTKCLGAAFPAYGKEGKKCVVEYAKSYNLPYDEKEIMASVIEESFAQSGKFVVVGLREVLLELFDISKDSDIKEIELAKLYHEQMEILKIFDKISKDEYDRNEKLLDELIDTNINEIGISGCKKKLQEYKNSLQVKANEMTVEEKLKYFDAIDLYKEYSGDECLINFIIFAENPE